jgi:hypothetical protein
MSDKSIDIMPAIDKLMFVSLVIFGGVIYLPLLLPSLFSDFFEHYSWITAISSVAALLLGGIAILILLLMVVLSVIRRKSYVSGFGFTNGMLAFIGFVGIFFIGT